MLNQIKICIAICVFITATCVSATWSSNEDIKLDQSPSPYQKPHTPADKSKVSINPPPFIWIPPKDDLNYVLEISTSSNFQENVMRYEDIDVSTYALNRTLSPGTWYWRYGVKTGPDKIIYSKTRSFIVHQNVKKWPYPEIDSVLDNVPEERPRLFVLKKELASFRQRAKSGDLRDLCNSIMRRCDAHIGEKLVEEPPYVKGKGAERGKNYQHIFRTTRPPMDMMEYCGLAYLLTSDRKYGDEAKRRILHFFSWDPKGSTAYSSNDEPAMWVMMRGVRAYDWTYDLFSEEEREKVENSMRIRAAQFYDHLKNRRRFHTNPYESHAGRTLGFLGEACLEFAHEWPESKEWLNYVLTLFRNVYPAWGKEDGGWHEGPSYWSDYMSFALHFVVPLRNATGFDLMQKPFFQNTPYYKLYTNPPYAEISPFGDGEHSGPNRSMGQLMYQFSTLLNDPYIRWYADFMDAGPGASILGVVLKDDSLKSKPPTDLPQSKHFQGVGLVSLHTALGNADKDVHFLIHSDPYGAISHAHADQNAFTLEAYGEALAIASGYYPWYGSDHHRHWQWESKSSNTITFNGGTGQKIRDPKSKGKIVTFVSKPEYDYVTADASQAYQGRLNKFLRRVIHLKSGPYKPGIFVICDEVTAPKPVTYEWNLHALSEMTLEEKDKVIIIKQGNARLSANFIESNNITMKQTKGFEHPPEYNEPDQYHAIVSSSGDLKSTKFITVLLPYKGTSTQGLPTELEGFANEEGFCITFDSNESIIAIKTEEEEDFFQFGDYQTDAELTIIHKDSQTGENQFHLYNGKTLKKDDKILLK